MYSLNLNYFYGKIRASQYLGCVVDCYCFFKCKWFFICHVFWTNKYNNDNVYYT